MFLDKKEAENQQTQSTSETLSSNSSVPSSSSSSSSSSRKTKRPEEQARDEREEKRRKKELASEGDGEHRSYSSNRSVSEHQSHFECGGKGNKLKIIAEDLVCGGEGNEVTAVQGEKLSAEATERLAKQEREYPYQNQTNIFANSVSISSSAGSHASHTSKRSPIELLADYYSGAFDPRLGEIYISPLTADSERASTESCLSLADKVNEFLDSSQRSLLLLGQAGMGKTYFSLLYCQTVWRRIREQLKEAPQAPLPRLLLYIYLPNYDKQLHREKQLVDKGTLLETTLKKHKFSDEEIEIMKTKPLLIFLDGFDEITFRENIYQLQGWGEYGYDIRVVVTCRPEVLLHKNLSALFEAGGEFSGQLATYTRQYLQPFTDEQIQEYFKACFETEVECERYLKQLEQLPSLKALVTTPFLLRMVADILPHIDKLPKKDAINTPHFTQSTVFHYFLEGVPNDKGEPCGGWFVKEIGRSRAKNLSSSCPKLSQKEVVRYMRAYAENLALFLLDNKTGQLNERSLTADETLQPELIELLHEYHPSTLFFDTDGKPNANFRDIRSSCLLHLYGCVDEYDYLKEGEFKFLHKSVTEYLVAYKVMTEELSLMQAAEHGVDTSPPRRGLNRAFLVKEPEIIARLAEAARENPDFKRRLIDVLLASKHTQSLGRVASNSITILNAALVSFYGWDLRAVCIAGADLTGAICDKANFSGADLTDVMFYHASLRETNLQGAQMTGVQFGEYPYLEFEDECNAVAYSPDGKYLAVASGKVIHLFDATTRVLLRRLTSHKGEVTSVTIGGYGKLLVSGSKDKTVRVWDVERGKVCHILIGHEDEVTSVTISGDGKLLASGSKDKTVCVWDVESGKKRHRLTGHEEWVWDVTLSTDGKWLASGSRDNRIQVWDSGEHVRILTGHNYFVNSVTFSPDGKILASAGSLDETILLWDVQRGKLLRGLTEHKHGVTYVVFSPNGNQVASGSPEGDILISDIKMGKILNRFNGHKGGVTSIMFRPDSTQLVSSSNDKTVRLWSVEADKPLYRCGGHKEYVTNVMFSPDGSQLVSASWDSTILLWNTQTSEVIYKFIEHESNVESVTFSPDGSQLASVSSDGTVLLWGVQTGELIDAFIGYEDLFNYNIIFMFSPDGSQLALVSSDGTVLLWSAQTGELISEFIEHEAGVKNITFSPDGSQLALASLNTVWIYDSQTSKMLHKLTVYDQIGVMTFSRDGKQLASGSIGSGTVWIWNTQTGGLSYEFTEHDREITSLAFSWDGSRLVSGSQDETIYIWNTNTGKVHQILTGHDYGVNVVTFSHDDKQLASADGDGIVRKWHFLEGVLLEASGIHYEEAVLNTFILSWSSHPSSILALEGARIDDVYGLSPDNQQLLEQRGAKGTPLASDELPNVVEMDSISPQTYSSSSSQLTSPASFFSSSALSSPQATSSASFVQQALRRLDAQHRTSAPEKWKQFVDWYLCREPSEEAYDEENRQRKSLTRIRKSTEQGINILASAQVILTGQQLPQQATSVDTDERQQSPSHSPSSLFAPVAANQFIPKEKEEGEEEQQEERNEKAFEH